MRFIVQLILVLLFINALLLDKALNTVTIKELKRRARLEHHPKFSKLYKLASYGKTTSFWLWLSGCVATAILLVMAVPHTWLWILTYIAVVAFLVKVVQPPPTTSSWVFGYSSFLAPANTAIVAQLQPLVRRFDRQAVKYPAAKVYEKEDLIELLKTQPNNPENRITDEELKIAAGALTFGDKKVVDFMVPLRKVRLVTEDELVGPMLMDELHKTGFSRFPVAKAKATNPELTGTLYLRDIILHEGGKVRDVMNKRVYYINEAQSLRDALAGYLNTHHHQFVVVNNFEEVVGVLSLEDVLEQILGDKIIDEFDRYDDLRAVAGLEAKREQVKHEHVESAEETPEQTEETVVE